MPLPPSPCAMGTVNTITEDLLIEGMSCRHCVDAVHGALAGVEGVTVQEVAIGRARVTYPTRSVTHDRLERAVEEAGFRVAGSRQIS